MKKFKLFTVLTLIVILFSTCANQGETQQKLYGSEAGLPDELQGLKVYSVGIGGGNIVKVAVLNHEVNSLTYSVGKSTQTTIVVNPNTYESRTIIAKEILVENDSIVVIRK